MDGPREIFDRQSGQVAATCNRLLQGQWHVGKTDMAIKVSDGMPMMRQIHGSIAQIRPSMVGDAGWNSGFEEIRTHLVQWTPGSVGHGRILDNWP